MKFKKLLAMVLAVAMIASLAPLVGTTAKAAENGTLPGKENTVADGVSITVTEDDHSGAYKVGETIKFTVTVTINQDFTTEYGKRLKIHLYNNDGNMQDYFKETVGSNLITYKLKSVTYSGRLGAQEGTFSDKQVAFQPYNENKGILVGAGAKIVLKFESEKTLTASDMTKKLNSFIAVFAGADNAKCAYGAYVPNSARQQVGTEEKGNLTVTNTVTGTDADNNKNFTYTIKLDDESVNGNSYCNGVNFAGGKATFTLKHNESKELKNLPVCDFTITESDYGGYTVKNKVDSGTESEGAEATGNITKDTTATVAFTNTKTTGTASKTLTYHLNPPDSGKDTTYVDEEPIGDDIFTIRELYVFAKEGEEDLSLFSELDDSTEKKIARGLFEVNSGGSTETYYFLGWAKKGSVSDLSEIDYVITDFSTRVSAMNKGKLTTYSTRGFTNPNPTITLTESTDLYAIWSTEPGFAGYSMSIENADFKFEDKEKSLIPTDDSTLKLGDNGYSGDGAYKYVVLDQTRRYEDEDSFTVTKAVPESDDYTFLGWFNKSANDTADTDRNDAYVVKAESSVSFKSTKSNHSLDAVWGAVSGADDASYLYEKDQWHCIDLSGLDTAFAGADYSDKAAQQDAFDALFNEGNVQYTVTINGEAVKNGDKDYFTKAELLSAAKATNGNGLTRTNVGTYNYTITAKLVIPDVANGKATDGRPIAYTAPEAIGTLSATLYIIGGLTVSKRVEGPGDTNKDFTFNVALTSEDMKGRVLSYTLPGGTSKTVSFDTEGKATINDLTLRDGQSVMLMLPAGTTYTVTEDTTGITDTYTTAYSIDGDASVAASTTGEKTIDGLVQVEFTNTRKSGDLTIKKEIKGGTEIVGTSSYTFTVTAPVGVIPDGTSFEVSSGKSRKLGTAVFNNDVADVDVELVGTDTGSVTIKGLPTGTYTVAEQGVSSDLYTTTYSLTDGKVTVAEGTSPVEITVTNTVNTGSLKVTKTFEMANRDADEPTDKTYDIEVELVFPIGIRAKSVMVGSDKVAVDAEKNTVKLTLNPDDKKEATISGIPVGTRYIVAEVLKPGQEGHYETTYSASPTGTISSAEASVTVQNKYFAMDNNTGALWIKKVVQGTGSGTYQFSVKFEQGDANVDSYNAFTKDLTDGTMTVTLGDGANKYILGIPAGTKYTITEDVSGGDFPANIEIEQSGAEASDIINKTGTYGIDKTVTGKIDESRDVDGYTFYNQYLANLTITKVFDSDVDIPAGTEFTFTLEFSGLRADQVAQLMRITDAKGEHNSDELLQEFTENHDSVTITLTKENPTAIVYDVPIGASHYRITETGDNMGDTVYCDVTAEAASNPTTESRTTGSVAFDESHDFVTFKNTYTGSGWLTIEKKVAGDGAPSGAEYTFQVRNASGAVRETVTITGEGSKTLLLPLGTYTVAETTTGGFTKTYAVGSATSTTPAEVTITAGATAKVTVTNTYVKPTGTLTIEKKVVDENGTSHDEDVYTFTVKDDTGTVVETVTVTGEDSVDVLLEAGEYTVTETTTGEDFSATYQVGTGTASDEPAQVTVTAGATAKVTVTNTYEKKGNGPVTPPSPGPGTGGGSGTGGTGSGDDKGDVIDRSEHYGYIIGVPSSENEVRPEQTITRAEIATILFRLLTEEARQANWSENSGFPDVESGDWYNHAVAVLHNLGIVEGDDFGYFNPDDEITRAEVATMVVRFYDKTTGTVLNNRFTDVDETKWYAEKVLLADYYGLMEGDGDKFKPEDLLTRAEAMTVFNRLLGRKPHKDHLHEGMITWIDNADKNKWYYADVQEATNSHECGEDVVIGETTYETWASIIPMRDWAALEY